MSICLLMHATAASLACCEMTVFLFSKSSRDSCWQQLQFCSGQAM
jgi:hypothetical protein